MFTMLSVDRALDDRRPAAQFHLIGRSGMIATKMSFLGALLVIAAVTLASAAQAASPRKKLERIGRKSRREFARTAPDRSLPRIKGLPGSRTVNIFRQKGMRKLRQDW